MIKLFFEYLTGGIAAGIMDALNTFVVTHMVTTEAYGKGMLFVSLINILFCFYIVGMDQVFVRFFYEQKYKVNSSLLFYRCILIVFPCFIVISVLLFYFKHKLFLWLEIDGPLIIPFIIMGASLLVLLRFTRLNVMLREKVLVYNLSMFFEKLFILLIFITVFYTFTSGYWTIILSQLTSIAMVVTGLLFISRKELILHFSQRTKIFTVKETKEFIKFGMPSTFSLGLHLVFVNLDKFFILKWSNYRELGIYTAAFALTGPLVLLSSTFETMWVPKMNWMLINSPFKSKKTFSSTFEKLSFTMTHLFMMSILFKHYLVLFIGPSFYKAINVFPWLLFAPYFWALSEVVVAGVVKSKKSYWHIYFSFCALCINVIGCCLLVPIFEASGAAISVAISFGGFFLVRWHIAFRYYSFKIKSFKLLIYISFICFFIIFSDTKSLNYCIFTTFVLTSFILEKAWLYKELVYAREMLHSKFNIRIYWYFSKKLLK